MGFNTPDVYHQPEKFDLVPVAELDYLDASYEFDFRVVWKHGPSGRLLTGRDSGCSCYSPFEEYTRLADLEDVVLAELEAEVRGAASAGSYVSAMEVADFLRDVRRAVSSAH